jgi:glycine/D-amino acid oxidase-like deaminating enzyme
MTVPHIAVVGGGILGTLVAREIGARSDATVTLLDRGTVGSGASLRSAGLHLPAGSSERVRGMAAYSPDYYGTLRREHPGLPVHPVGMTVVAAESGAGALRERYLDGTLTRTDSVPWDEVRIPGGSGAWEVEGCHYADVGGVAQILAGALRPRVGVREGVRVTGVDPDDHGAVRLRLGTGETLAADRVVLAPGPWLHDPAFRDLVAPLGIRVKKVVALHVERRPEDDARVVFFQDDDAFLLPLRHRGHWLFSYTCTEWDVDPDALHDGLSAAHLEQAREVLGRYAPGLVADCAAGRVFCDAYSPDRQPRVLALDPAGRIVLAGAANGSGYRLAPAMAARAAEAAGFPDPGRPTTPTPLRDQSTGSNR